MYTSGTVCYAYIGQNYDHAKEAFNVDEVREVWENLEWVKNVGMEQEYY